MAGSWILFSFFLAVLTGTLVVGYAILFRGQTAGTASPVVAALQRIGRAAPVRPKDADRLWTRLRLAGYRLPSAAPIFTGIRVACGGLAGVLIFGIAAYYAVDPSKALLYGLLAALFGFMLPNFILNRRITQRAQQLRAGLPAALDLIVLSLEAGQSLDAALIETSRELRQAYPELHDELALVHFEILASKSRAEAFRNLAARNPDVEFQRLAQVLIDADRFGTRLAPALRSHVHYLRLRMRNKANEAARKISVKLVFPVFFLIFPAVLLVTLGPAVLQIVSQLAPMFNSIP